LRYDDRFVVRIAQEAVRDQVVSTLTSAGAPLAGYAISEFIRPEVMILSADSTASKRESVDLAQVEKVAGVEWVTPLFQAGQNGSWIEINDEVIVSLKPFISADQFFGPDLFGSVFKSWRPLLGTADQFVATLAHGAGLDALAFANGLHGNGLLQWASPNLFADTRPGFTPTDALFADQWTLNNTGQTGALNNGSGDANLPAAWDVTQGSSDLVIAVIDDGVQTNHPDLNIWVNSGEIAGNGADDDGNGWSDE